MSVNRIELKRLSDAALNECIAEISDKLSRATTRAERQPLYRDRSKCWDELDERYVTAQVRNVRKEKS